MTLQMPKSPSSGEPSKTSGRTIDPIGSFSRHWRLAAIGALVVLSLGLPTAWWKGKPRWRAEGALYVSPRFLRNLDTDQEHEIQSDSQYRQFVQQQVRTVNRYDILAQIMSPETPGARYWLEPKEGVQLGVDRLRGVLQISPVPDTYQIAVGLEGKEQAGLAEIVNAVMESYVRTAHRELLFDSEERLKNLAAEQQELQSGISKLVEQRTAIAQKLGTTVFNGSLVNSFDRQLGSSAEALMEARRQRIVAEAQVGTSAQPAGATLATALQSALSDNSLNAFKAALTQRKAELMVSMNGLSPQHSARIAAEKEIRAIDQEVEAVTAALRDRLAGNLEMLNRAKLEQSSAVEGRLQGETQKIAEKIEEYSRGYQKSLELGEELDRMRKRLHSVEDRINYLQLETRAPGFVRVFSPALTPLSPFEGGRKKLGLIVLLVALVVAIVIPVGKDYLDPRIKGPQELEFHLGVPITGWLPEMKTLDAASLLRPAVFVRRHIQQLPHPVLIVSALKHGGGSSTVSLGLAAALNRLGTRTLVVEANPITPDPRYGSAGGIIPWIGSPGSALPVIPATETLPERIATGPGGVEDLLPVENLFRLTEECAGKWDLIIVDAAPIDASLATEELIRVFGSALMVIDSQRDQKQAITRCLDKLDRLAPHAFGAVLNKVAAATSTPIQGLLHHDSTTVFAA